MLLAVDIGNSTIIFGVWTGNEWNTLPRMDTHPVLDDRSYREQIHKLFDLGKIDQNRISSIIISSVVPAVTGQLSKSLADLFHLNPVLLNADTNTGIEIRAEHPERVGADLIAGAVGAHALTGDTCIVVDFGTATTLMAVEKPGVLSGGAICAGLNVSVEALVGKTAQLQEIPVKIPKSPLGKNTVEAMQSGLVLGHLCMVEGLIDRIKTELGAAKVVATGGLVSLMAPHTDYFDYEEPNLTLDGLRIIAERQNR